jgi:plasmid replication initiation protein
VQREIQRPEGAMSDEQKNYDHELSQLRDYKVIKSNDLIQKSRFDLGTQEQKIVLYLISKIRPEDTELHEYEFSIVEFCKICGIDYANGKNYDNIKKTIKSLNDKSIWVTLNDGGETTMRWIERPYINKNSGVIKIKLDELMKPYLLQMQERFTQYELLYTLPMKSQYAIRLYEILKSYEWKKSVEMDLENLKRMMKAEHYTRFYDFKKKVIEIAMREIDDYTDLKVEYTLKKKGKQFTSIVFQIGTKETLSERLLTWQKINQQITPKRDSKKTITVEPEAVTDVEDEE